MSDNQNIMALTNVSKSSPELKPTDDIPHIHRLPLEIIAKIVRQLSLNDVTALLTVSKIWRSSFLNQNVIWKDICKKLSVRSNDYGKCLNDSSSHYVRFSECFESDSINYFGPLCYWWQIYNQYNMVLKNIKENIVQTVRIPRQQRDVSFCTDNYIVNMYRSQNQCKPIQVIFLGSKRKPTGVQFLLPIDNFIDLYGSESMYKLKIIGNDEFLVLEIHSVIFVYNIINDKFVNGYSKVIKRAEDPEIDDTNIHGFIDNHSKTKIDLSDDKLALIRPYDNVVFIIDLKSGEICEELEYSSNKCVVDTMKFADNILMIGTSTQHPQQEYDLIHLAIMYHLDDSQNYKQSSIALYGAATEFKVIENFIGIENENIRTPILITVGRHTRIIWIECNTFSFDNTRNFLYYSQNNSIFQCDLNAQRQNKYDETRKIDIEPISGNFSLTPINDRFLLVQSLVSRSYDIFDVKFHNAVKSIPVYNGLKLTHVGKLCLVFANAKEFVIFAFG